MNRLRQGAGQTFNQLPARKQDTRTRTPRTHRLRGAMVAAILLLGVTACMGRINTHGNKPDPDFLAEILEEKYSKAEVEKLIGTPSTVAMFSNETWLYISNKVETFIFLEPEIMEQTVVAIRFSEADEVASIDTLGVEDGRLVYLNENATPTLGNEFSALEQMINNIGRFSR